MRVLRAAMIALAGLAAAVPLTATAQEAVAADPLFRSPILTIDPDALFSQSLFGQRISAQLQAETDALAAENRRIEADLTAEERSLTERRPTMAPEAFRAEAEAFDTKVQGIRSAQDAKERDLQRTLTEGRDAFLEIVRPILGTLMQERGSVLILDRRSVFLGLGVIDITDEAIAAVDAAVGDGSDQTP